MTTLLGMFGLSYLQARTAGIVVALASFAAAAQAPSDIRVALVIGNSAYPSPGELANPANDATAMSAALRRLGFEVYELRDAGKTQMVREIERVSEALKGKRAVGMLYYAGHGLQLDWHNYMVPIDARMNSAAEVPAQAVDINVVLGAFKAAGNRMNIVVLDACRDNPFSGSGSAKGLAPLDAPQGTFLAYATAPGNVAGDGEARTGNGLYTQ
ncbi:MAG: caspase family protein, partial [Ramlibacter sp.]